MASVVINVTEVGGNVVFAASGSLDLAGASSAGAYGGYGKGFISGGSNWYVAPGPGGATKSFAFTSFDGPFGTSASFVTPPTSESGDDFFIWGQSGLTAQVGVDVGYVSGGAISSGMVFNGATIAGLNMTAGTYHYRLPSDEVILNIGGTVPEPASLGLVALALAGLGAVARRRH